RRSGKALLPFRQKLLFQISIGLFQRASSGQPEPLHQPVLKGPETALEPSLGLRRVGRNPFDTQLLQRASDLSASLAPLQLLLRRRRPVHPKQAGLVGIERQGSAPPLDVVLHHPQILFRGIVPHKPRTGPAGGVIQHGDQIQLLPSSFQPGMLRSVPLHQLPPTTPSWSPSMYLFAPSLPPLPDPGLDHGLTQRLPADP